MWDYICPAMHFYWVERDLMEYLCFTVLECHDLMRPVLYKSAGGQIYAAKGFRSLSLPLTVKTDLTFKQNEENE